MAQHTFIALQKEFKTFHEAKLYQIWSNPHEFDSYILPIAHKTLKSSDNKLFKTLKNKHIQELAAYCLGVNSLPWPFALKDAEIDD